MRLPRDWLGPREELVPIGPAARAREREAARSDPAGTLPPAAHDFWGEDSAALHDAIQGPPNDSRAPIRRVRWSLTGIRHALWFAHLPHGRVRARLMLGVTATALAAIATAVLATGTPTVAGRHRPTPTTSQVARVNETALTAAKRSAATKSAHLARAGRSGAARRTAHARAHRPRTTAQRPRQTTHKSGTRRAPAHPVDYSAPTYTPVSNTAPVQSTSSAPAASSNATQSSPPSGPVGQGAPFGPGRVG